MKTLPLFMITIFVLFASTVVMADAFAQNNASPPQNDLGDGNPFFMTIKGSFLPGQLVEISGNLVTVDPIQIVLDNPQGMMKASKTTFSDRDGYFASDLKIPSDAKAGNWAIVGASGIYHKESNFTILGNSDTVTCYAGNLCSKSIANTTVQYGPKTTVSIDMKSPLEQFKSGIKPEYVKCSQDLHLIIKAEDGSFACVTIETGKNLAIRGWATTFGTGISTNDYYTKCDTLYPQSDTGIAVLYMPTNSIGKICVKYSNPNDTPVPIVGGIRIFDPNNSYLNATDITTWIGSTSNMIPKGDSTMVYWIKTGNQTGFYGLRFSCGGTPFAVGYDDNSKIVSSDFPFVGVTHSCPVMLYDVKIEGLTGIGVRYIPYP
ncbi:MAG: hypothetical protein KGH99_00965 [Thaumarchaeota archaeon]|nr:hypothetical protein [Candidatus Nitrosotalea sp.]MDE1872030.1 hypothetical protein [Nitrososphaerota archaeon]